MSLVLLLLTSCRHDRKQYTEAITCRDSVPQMTTYDITSLVSDSGVVRYRIVAPRWDVYDRLNPSRWSFEEGVYLEKFTDSLTIDATVKADTAYYYDQDELWELRGHVHIENLDDDVFDTSLLFWNQEKERVWSDEFIRIRKANGSIITGYGFTSNQQFTNYRIHNTQGTFPVDEESGAPRTDSGEVIADSAIVGTDENPRPTKSQPTGVSAVNSVQPAAKQAEAVPQSRPTFEKVEPASSTGKDRSSGRKPISKPKPVID